ncbi:hypothetical protein AAFC00_001039 [Neodothiora populina]|uniref:CBF1-interacting co-repressor CIR N-terminal domain-containing protein n=1 Tax=Neodothiora populina TaxID=2781224 RepID=A0ABR3PMV9_9PEZI
MVLHLLGKKSWNVYNNDNVERVKRDEAVAAAKEEEHERLMQEQDAQRRTALLRGEKPPEFEPIPEPLDSSAPPRQRNDDGFSKEERKLRRRLRDEDETSYAIRVAKLDRERAEDLSRSGLLRQRPSSHDDSNRDRLEELFNFGRAVEDAILPAPTAVSETHTRKKKTKDDHDHDHDPSNAQKQQQDPHAFGPSNLAAIQKKPAIWDLRSPDHQGLSRDAFGRPDPKRTIRDQKRLGQSDPLAFMKQAQEQLKQAKAQRAKRETEIECERRASEMAQKEERHRDSSPRQQHHKRHEDRSRSPSRRERSSRDDRGIDSSRRRYRRRSASPPPRPL